METSRRTFIFLGTFHMFHVKRYFPDVWWDGQVTEPCVPHYS
jgi:hypothetical protein